MKSLVAVAALASALGVGYWKMQNPDGGIDEARAQAQALYQRLGKGVAAVREGNAGSDSAQASAELSQVLDARLAEVQAAQASAQSALENRIAELESGASAADTSGVTADSSALENRIAQLEVLLDNGTSATAAGDAPAAAALESRIADIENLLQNNPAPVTSGDSSAANAESAAMVQRLDSIDDTLATAATLASDTESRMVQIEQTLATMQTSPQTDGADAAALNELRSSLQGELASQNDQLSKRLNDLDQQLQSALAASQQTEQVATRLGALEEQLTQLQQSTQQDTASQLEASRAVVDNQLDGLRDRLQSLTEQGSDASASQTASAQKLADMEDKLAGLTTRLNTLASGAVSTGTGSGDGDSAATSAALASVTAQVDQRLAAIEERVAEATASDTRTIITDLQSRLDAATTRMQDLEKSLAGNLDASVGELGNSVSTLDTSVGNLSTTVDGMTGDVSSLGTQLGSLQSELSTLQNGFGEMESSLSSVSGDLETLKSTVESYAVEDLQNDLQTKLDSLETRIQSTPASDIESLKRTLEQSRDRIQTLEQRVTELPAASDESDNARKAQDALQQQIAALEKRLNNPVPGTDPELADTLSAVQQKVDEFERRRYVTAEDLQRSTQTRTIQYKIYFDKSQIAISDEAAKVLDSFIAQESNRATSISIFGTTDRTGSAEYNEQLAKRRANRVRSYLIQRGYDFTKIGAVDGIGEDLAAAELPDGEEDPNLRSVIIYAYQP